MSSKRDHTPESAQRCADAASLLAEARAAAGVSTSRLAEECGVSRALVRAWEDASDPSHVPPADALLAPCIAAHAVRVLAARAGMVAVDLPSAEVKRGDDHRMLADVHRETSEVVSKHLAALADGHVTRRENAELRREIREAQVVLAQLDVELAATAHEPVVGVRRIDGWRR